MLTEIVDDFKGVGYRRGFFEHDRRRTIFFMGQLDCSFHQIGLQVASAYREMEVDAGEDLWVFLGTFRFQRHIAPAYVLAALAQNEHHVVSRAAAGAGEHDFHGPWRQVASAAFRSAVHGDQVARAGFGCKCHAGQTRPAHCAFHRILAEIKRVLL